MRVTRRCQEERFYATVAVQGRQCDRGYVARWGFVDFPCPYTKISPILNWPTRKYEVKTRKLSQSVRASRLGRNERGMQFFLNPYYGVRSSRPTGPTICSFVSPSYISRSYTCNHELFKQITFSAYIALKSIYNFFRNKSIRTHHIFAVVIGPLHHNVFSQIF